MQCDSPNVFVGKTGTTKRRGEFAARRHVEGAIAETCPVVLFSATLAGVCEEVRKRLFNWGALSGRVSDNHCDALGYRSMCNHDNPSKMRYEGDAATNVLRFVATRPIAQGEELP